MKVHGFSLVEIVVALIILSVITAALAPIITKKLKSNTINLGKNTSSAVKFSDDCSDFGSDCTMCTNESCALCNKDCAQNEYKDVPNCLCRNCGEIHIGCLECTSKKCKKCENGYGLNNGKCYKCTKGYYGNGLNCIAASIGNYVPEDGATFQTPCPAGQYQDEIGKPECKVCQAGSYQNVIGQSSCKTCEIDYACSGGNNRVQCAPNMGADEGSSNCSPCSTNCTNCKVPSACLGCNSGYYLSNDSCIICPQNYRCDGLDKIQCSYGYYSQQGSSTCTVCPSNCATCSSGSTCTSCKSGYILNDGNCISNDSSLSCNIANCRKCNSDGSCYSCNEYYFLNNNNTCSNCPPNCRYCNSANNCTVCAGDHYLENGTCYACPSECMTCNSKTECTYCRTVNGIKHYLNNGTCTSCGLNCSSCVNDLGCLACESGYYLENSICQSCPSHCLSCNSKNKCNTCEDGYVLQNGSCEMEEVVCSSELTNCTKCLQTNTNCVQCATGYTLIDNRCVKCVQYDTDGTCSAYYEGGFTYPCCTMKIKTSCQESICNSFGYPYSEGYGGVAIFEEGKKDVNISSIMLQHQNYKGNVGCKTDVNTTTFKEYSISQYGAECQELVIYSYVCNKLSGF